MLTEQENTLKHQNFGRQENRATVTHSLKFFFYFITQAPSLYIVQPRAKRLRKMNNIAVNASSADNQNNFIAFINILTL